MAIPRSQLETWANQGATTTSANTYQSIRNALLNNPCVITGREVDIYLQGSYRNSTNIRGDSDVDVVVQCSSSYISDYSGFSPTDQMLIQRYAPYTNPNSIYDWIRFRGDVLVALQQYYGVSNVSEGNKSLKLARTSGRLGADVVPGLQYRKHQDYASIGRRDYAEGICFWTRKERRQVINYPKSHYNNGAAKNGDSATKGWYKPSVRLFKNARAYLYDKGVISKDLSRSYFVECLLYNAPNNLFESRLDHVYCNVINHLGSCTDDQLKRFVCQNRQIWLFGPTPEQWDIPKARKLIATLIDLWNGW